MKTPTNKIILPSIIKSITTTTTTTTKHFRYSVVVLIFTDYSINTILYLREIKKSFSTERESKAAHQKSKYK